MGKHFFPTPELQTALAALLGLEKLDRVRSIKINLNGREPITVDVEMFIWDHDVLTSVVEQLTADPERETNVKIEVTLKLLEQVDRINVQGINDLEPVYVDGPAFDHSPPDMLPCLAHGPHPHTAHDGACLDCPQCTDESES